MELGIPVEGTEYFVVLNVHSGISRYVSDGGNITLTDYGIVIAERELETYSDLRGVWTYEFRYGKVFHPWQMVERIEELTQEQAQERRKKWKKDQSE